MRHYLFSGLWVHFVFTMSFYTKKYVNALPPFSIYTALDSEYTWWYFPLNTRSDTVHPWPPGISIHPRQRQLYEGRNGRQTLQGGNQQPGQDSFYLWKSWENCIQLMGKIYASISVSLSFRFFIWSSYLNIFNYDCKTSIIGPIRGLHLWNYLHMDANF